MATSVPRTKGCLSALLVFLAILSPVPSFSQSSQDRPTKKEIAAAYRSKSGEGGLPIIRFRREQWRIREIRGWSLNFKRVNEDREVGVVTLRYQALRGRVGTVRPTGSLRQRRSAPIPGSGRFWLWNQIRQPHADEASTALEAAAARSPEER